MITTTDIGTQNATSTSTSTPAQAPACVSQLLATLDAMSAALSKDQPNGPYAFDAVLEDLNLCPALFEIPNVNSDRHAGLVDAIEQARGAVRVVRSCPGSDRQWAVERLRTALEAARRQLEARVRNTDANGDRAGVFGDRCSTCVFAGH